MTFGKKPVSLTQEMQVKDYYDRLGIIEWQESKLKSEHRREQGLLDEQKDELQNRFKRQLEEIHKEKASLDELKRTINRQSVIIF